MNTDSESDQAATVANAAALECKMNEVGNPGLIPRNRANRILLSNAAVVLAQGLEPSTLFYPRDLTASKADVASTGG